MSGLISGARHWYEKGGSSTLLKNATIYASGATMTKVTAGGYSGLLAESCEPTELGERYWMLDDDTDNLSTSIYDGLASFAAREGKEFKRQPSYEFHHPFVVEATDAYLIGPHATAITEDTVYGDAIRTDIDKTRWMLNQAVVSSPRRVGSVLSEHSRPSGVKQIDTACLLYHHTGNFYHWVIEQFPKLRAIERYEAETGKDVTVIIRENTPSYVDEFLEICGYVEDFVRWDGEPYWIKNLVVPSLPEPTPGSLDWLQERATNMMSETDDTVGWVYVSRQNASRGRRIENWDETKAILRDYNIRILDPEELSLKEEIRIFISATGVIGPHGAGLTAIVWSEELEVIELFNDVVKPAYYLISTVQGQDYAPIANKGSNKQKRKINQDIVLETDMLSELLNKRCDGTV